MILAVSTVCGLIDLSAIGNGSEEGRVSSRILSSGYARAMSQSYAFLKVTMPENDVEPDLEALFGKAPRAREAVDDSPPL